MSDFNEIAKLWQNAPAPGAEDISILMKGIRKKRKQLAMRGFFGLISLLFTAIFIAWIGIEYDAKFITTRIGVVITLIAVIGGMGFSSQALKYILWPLDNATDNMAYLAKMKEYQHKQYYMQTTGMMAYFIVLSIGMALYMYEFTHANLPFMLIAYGLTFGWILFAWVYIRPRQTRIEREKLNTIIEQLERVVGQIGE